MWRRAVCLFLVAGALASSLERYSGRAQQLAPDRPRTPYLMDPTLYLITGPELQDEDEGVVRGKRTGPSLSIVEPIDVLRNRVMFQMRQRLQKQNENQVLANRLLLKAVGKRQARFDRLSETGENMEYYRNLGEPEWESS